MKRIIIILIMLFSLCAISSCKINELFCKHDYELTSTTDSTCESYGKNIFTCTKCGKVKDELILKKDHEYTEYEITKAASCTETGLKERHCIHCGKVDKVTLPKTEHDYKLKSIIDATCTKGKLEHYVCKDCDTYKDVEISEPLGHNFGGFTVVKDATDTEDGLISRTCSRCDYVEEIIVPANNYIDQKYLKMSYSATQTNFTANSKEELSNIFNFCCLHLLSNFTVKANFSFDLNELLAYLGEHYDIGFDYGVSATASFSNIKFTMQYPNASPTLKASEDDLYHQVASLNYQIPTSSRSDTFNDFKIYSSTLSMDNIKTSDQLFYAAEHFAVPNVVANSEADIILKEAKKVLRQINDDTMSDYEKVLNIYNYLIMNTCYDKALYDLSATSKPVSSYRGFYLEGVFLDHRAVCEGISKAVVLLCNLEGIRCVQETGYQTANPEGMGHAWNKLFVGGKWYILDATSGGTILNSTNEVLTYQYFLIDDESYKEKYTGKNFNYIYCVNNYNVYKDMTFEYLGRTYDYNLESSAEFTILIAYIESLHLSDTTIEFYIDYVHDESVVTLINAAYAANSIAAGYNYLSDGNVVMLIK